MRLTLIALLLASFLSGCSTTLDQPKAYITTGEEITLPQARTDLNFDYKQLLTIHYAEDEHSLIVLLTSDSHGLKAFALSPMSLQLFEAGYSPQGLVFDKSLMAVGLPKIEQILLDILLCYYSEEDFSQVKDLRFQHVDEQTVDLYYNDQRIKTISYRDGVPVGIKAHDFNYEITIEYLE